MKRIFLTFSDSRLCRSQRRIRREAESLSFFDEIITLSETDLDESFCIKFGEKLKPKVRGFGYWVWKPQVIKQTLEKMVDGDVVLYVDVGCCLNPRGKERLHEYFRIAETSDTGVLAFQGIPPSLPLLHDGRPLPDLTEKLWTKGDVLDYFSVREKPEITETQTCGAGVILIKKCQRSMLLVDEWLKAINTSFALIDDSPSISNNSKGFIEHRHDQALFSILCKLFEVETVSAYEYSYPGWRGGEDWSMLEKMPIHAKRDLDFGFIGNTKRFVKNKIHGLKMRIHAK